MAGRCRSSRAVCSHAHNTTYLPARTGFQLLPLCLCDSVANSENALTFHTRQTPFNPAFSVQFCHHAKSPLTNCGSALCAISSDESPLNLIRKSTPVSRCPSTALDPIRPYSYVKNLAFFSGHFDGKTLENQAKTVQKTPQNRSIILQLLTCFFPRNLSIKVNGRRLADDGLARRSGTKTAGPWQRWPSAKTGTILCHRMPQLTTMANGYIFSRVCLKSRGIFFSHTLTMKKILGGFLILAASLSLADPPGASPLAEANNGFAFNLLKQIEQTQPAENIFISPYSVSLTLQMLDNGAAGQTRTEIQSVLQTKKVSPDELNAACQDLNDSLLSQPDVILDLADAIWYQKGFALKKKFISDNTKFFQAELAPVDFNTPKAADIINHWAEKRDAGKSPASSPSPFRLSRRSSWPTRFISKANGPSRSTPMKPGCAISIRPTARPNQR